MWNAIAAVGAGAALGALLRWVFALRLNGVLPSLSLGTLTANLVGGYIVGMALAWLADNPSISPAWRLFAITGFCGGLTTFSAFSAEVVVLLQQGRTSIAVGAIAAHVLGSLAMTAVGIVTWNWISGR